MNNKVIAIVYSFVGEVFASILIGFFVGRFLDRWLNTYPTFMILFMLMGVFTSLYLLIKRVNNVEDKNEKKE
jgi:F0F1-type ATP synthase assembly protein I